MRSPVITFYSYKGGVGRTFALANIGAVMARWGHRVLCVDWDLEAPGLHRYFEKRCAIDPHDGLLEWVEGRARGETPDWRDHVVALDITEPEIPGRVDLMMAGRVDDTYIDRVQDLDWRTLYAAGIGDAIEEMRAGWVEAYDYILVDSRTGITDIGGICAAQLPDILVFVVTANLQSLDGAIDAVERARAQRAKLPVDRGGFLTLPLPSRFDAREEYELGQQWLETFAKRLAPYYQPWLDAKLTPRDMLDVLRVPYLSYWSFGERIATLDERLEDPENISYSLAITARLLASRLTDSGDLASDRRRFVSEGEARYDFFIGSSGTTDFADRLEAALVGMSDRPLRMWTASRLKLGDHITRITTEVIASSSVLVYISTETEPLQDRVRRGSWSRELQLVAEAYDSQGKRLVPVLVGTAPNAPPPLRDLLGLRIEDPEDRDQWSHVADRLLALLD